MTTKSIPISSITIARPERQRRELSNLPQLKASLRRVGQINPITVTPDRILIAGERRLTAATELGWDSILATIRDEEPTQAQRLLELEENLERDELPWKDHCLAIADLHQILGGTAGQTAKYAGQSASEVSRRLMVARALLDGDSFVCDADRYSVAVNFLSRKAERAGEEESDRISDMLSGPTTPALADGGDGGASDNGLDDLLSGLGLGDGERSDSEGHPEVGEELPRPAVDVEHPTPFLLADFHDWSRTYSGPSFNFVHCDFPYGINVDKHNGSGSSFGGYADSKDVYFQLLATLADFTERHVADSAHLMFWYAFKFHRETEDALREMGWVLQERPLIWLRSDNSGVLPDPKRGPRWVYETCIMASRGDRPIVQPVANSVAHPNIKDIHKSEKPVAMLSHFFRMFVDESTRMIDPTMGSGNAVYVAEGMGAKSAIGLERDPEFLKAAVAKYNKRKNMYREGA